MDEINLKTKGDVENLHKIAKELQKRLQREHVDQMHRRNGITTTNTEEFEENTTVHKSDNDADAKAMKKIHVPTYDGTTSTQNWMAAVRRIGKLKPWKESTTLNMAISALTGEAYEHIAPYLNNFNSLEELENSLSARFSPTLSLSDATDKIKKVPFEDCVFTTAQKVKSIASRCKILPEDEYVKLFIRLLPANVQCLLMKAEGKSLDQMALEAFNFMQGSTTLPTSSPSTSKTTSSNATKLGCYLHGPSSGHSNDDCRQMQRAKDLLSKNRGSQVKGSGSDANFPKSCWTCGSRQHLAINCPEKVDSSKLPFKRTVGAVSNSNVLECTHCKRKGHLVDRCLRTKEGQQKWIALGKTLPNGIDPLN